MLRAASELSSLAPPYPADTRARGWRFEVDMEKVKASDTWLRAKTGELRGALLLLWSESWQQTPCGTLPADDELVALIIDMPLPKFAKNRAVLMRGWWLATDGRLYHDTITERVLCMLDKRMKDAERAANRRARQAAAAGESPAVTGASRVTHDGLHGEFDTKHQAPSTSTSSSSSLRSEEHPPTPRKRGKAATPLVSLEQMVADGVQEAHARDWLAIRKEKRLPLTETAWDYVKDQAATAGMSVDEAIHTSVVNSWAGFKAKWLDQPGAAPGAAQPLSAGGEQTLINAASIEARIFGNRSET